MAPCRDLTRQELKEIYLAVHSAWGFVREMSEDEGNWLEKWITECIDNREYSHSPCSDTINYQSFTQAPEFWHLHRWYLTVVSDFRRFRHNFETTSCNHAIITIKLESITKLHGLDELRNQHLVFWRFCMYQDISQTQGRLAVYHALYELLPCIDNLSQAITLSCV